MNIHGINKSMLKEIAQKYALDPVVLFGSQSTGQAVPQSDVDLAVRTSTPRDERSSHREAGLWKELSNLVEGELDWVLLNDASPLLLFEVAMEGKPLFEQSPNAF